MSADCPCGRPLHYTDPRVQRLVQRLVDDLGPDVTITVMLEGRWRSWRVPRHFIALHGVTAVDLPTLGFEEITPRAWSTERP